MNETNEFWKDVYTNKKSVEYDYAVLHYDCPMNYMGMRDINHACILNDCSLHIFRMKREDGNADIIIVNGEKKPTFKDNVMKVFDHLRAQNNPYMKGTVKDITLFLSLNT